MEWPGMKLIYQYKHRINEYNNLNPRVFCFTTKTSMPPLFGCSPNSCQLQQNPVLSVFEKKRPEWPNTDNGHYFLINSNGSHHSHIYFVINSDDWVLPVMNLSQSTFWCTIFIEQEYVSSIQEQNWMPMFYQNLPLCIHFLEDNAMYKL